MKSNESRLLILVVCAILGFLLISQISFSKSGTSKIYTFSNYQQAVSELNKLNGEINLLKTKKNKLEQNLLGKSSQTTTQTIKQFDEDLTNYSFDEGLSNVKGKGFIITLSDNLNPNINYDTEMAYNPLAREPFLVHNFDLNFLVWELKNQSAEAISINGQRIVSSTGISCAGPTIMINGVKLAPPYEIRIIGDPVKLASYIERKDYTYYNHLKARNLVVSSKKYDSSYINIPSYLDDIEFRYAKPVNN